MFLDEISAFLPMFSVYFFDILPMFLVVIAFKNRLGKSGANDQIR